ncbi:MAG: PfkB family carbohydrate kinase [Acidobacteriota bacterium]|nr:PfkB family carbohydrate kinase [Acidobacteriota bacterium]
MSILTVGSVAYDDIVTPYDTRLRALGGSATYFALAAQHFTQISLVAVVGEDFNLADEDLLRHKGIDLKGLEKVAGKCFYWKGEYLANWNDRVTHDTQLNVFEHFQPKVPDNYRDAKYVFLGNIHPSLQAEVLRQMNDQPKMVALDTMNLWIKETRQDLIDVLGGVNVLLVNDSEAMMLSGQNHLIDAARTISQMGPQTLCIKQGEHGALLVQGDRIFIAPAYPLCKVIDPTGAGDCFAGGFMGYLAQTGDHSFENMKRAIIYGSVLGSFTVEAFSVDRCAGIDMAAISKRYHEFVDLCHFHE